MFSTFSRTLAGMTAMASILLLTGAARADMPPPDGEKYVPYSFTVHGINAPDRVVFVFPCSANEVGAPLDDLRIVENDKPVAVGRRGGTCGLYAIAKTEYESFKKTYTPTGRNGDPALAAFAAKATKCSGGPTPLFVLDSGDSRTSTSEDLDVTALDATTCTVTSRGAPKGSEGCSVGGTPGAAAPWLVALAAPFFLFGSRRRRKG